MGFHWDPSHRAALDREKIQTDITYFQGRRLGRGGNDDQISEA
jgi:hypothetical protein